MALGVILPVLPTVNFISFKVVKTSLAGNLYAIPHLGTLDVNPNLFSSSRLSTLSTTPSISNGRLSLFSDSESIYLLLL